MSWLDDKNTTKKYQNLRVETRKVVEKITDFAAKHHTITKAAKSLGMLNGKTIVMNSESDTSYLMDYALFEVKIGAQTTLEYFYDYGPELSAKEDEYLATMLENYTSFFEITGLDKANATVHLIDILNDNKPLSIVDIALSQNQDLVGVLLFSRILTFDDLNMTSGASMTFFAYYKTDLLNRLSLLKFKNRGQLSRAQLFAFFYNQHLSIGVETRFEE
ncbi:MAG: hypothetical protein EAZ32_18695 [Cytophagia bacterium]|nr:MAG: hypothetical protein EAZ46_12730 [Runella sp.]TAG24358.1 MAG: hypothetical protein EAZ38_01340 [Cytophagales bacterium]TAG35195.1 MAG: hypothetical protein EAZ32_18695 [Cytophagia bacterium]TAG51341.1 MAG: hypothetical protein EAZ29_09945 [Runella slithyformis]TAG77127.1 MAG: hypothetical protein EAZ22_16370 [Cytophagales bacterium]